MKAKCSRCNQTGHTHANCPVCQAMHAIKRAKERYGVDLTTGDLRNIAGMIQGGQSQFVRTDTTRVSEHIVEYDGVRFRVAYDKHRKKICSFLPM